MSSHFFLTDINGTLAMPLNKETHDLIYRNMVNGNLFRHGIGAWLGFNKTGGVWTFLNGDIMNLSPNFESDTTLISIYI